MSDVSRAGSALVTPSNQYSTQDFEMGKFTITNGTVAVNTNQIGGASGYAEGTTVGTIVGNALVYRNSGGTLQTVQIGGSALPVTQDTLIAGEDLTNNILKVNQVFSYSYNTTVGTTVIKASAGFLHGIFLTNPSAGGALIAYDNASGTSASIIYNIGTNAITGFYPINAIAANGIVIANVGTQTYTAVYR